MEQLKQMKMVNTAFKLDSGKYKVIFEKPAGLTQTGTNTTEDDKDADGGEVDVTITDHDDFTLDNGYYEKKHQIATQI